MGQTNTARLAPTPAPNAHPVLLVHGIWDSGEKLAPMRRHLEGRGIGPVEAIDLRPNDGSAPLEVLAGQLSRAVEALRARTGAERIDLVGFSMGSLVSRFYLQRLGGKDAVRRFVSISGPHQGTWTAYFTRKRGGLQMRPGSAFLRELEADADPFGDVEVTCLYTPLDLMIFPSSSSLLTHAKTVKTFPVALHHLMLTDEGVLSAVTETLLAP